MTPISTYGAFMANVELRRLSVRLTTETYGVLRDVSETVGRPMSKLIQVAVVEYLEKETHRLAEEISPRVEALRGYARNLKANRREAVNALIDAEAEHGGDDPAEGTRV